MNNQIYNILSDMSESLNISQMKYLQGVLLKRLEEDGEIEENIENQEYMELFLSSKRIEGCSERTISYYRSTIENLLFSVKIPIRKMTTVFSA